MDFSNAGVLSGLPPPLLQDILLAVDNLGAVAQTCKLFKSILQTERFLLDWAVAWWPRMLAIDAPASLHPVLAALAWRATADPTALALGVCERLLACGHAIDGVTPEALAAARTAAAEGRAGDGLRALVPHPVPQLVMWAAQGRRTAALLQGLSGEPGAGSWNSWMTIFLDSLGHRFIPDHGDLIIVPPHHVLITAARKGDLRAVLEMCEEGVHQQEEYEMRPYLAEILEVAARAGNLDCMRACLEGMPKITHAGKKYKRKPGSFALAAAAASGSLPALHLMLQTLGGERVRQGLPAALCAAGAAGAVDAMRALLALPAASTRPLALAATNAGERGWHGPALDALLGVVLARGRQQLDDVAGQLREGLAAALAARHAATADSLWAAFAQGAPTPEQCAQLMPLLAQRGHTDRVRWLLRAAPGVMTIVEAAPALAALEAGHLKLGALLLEHAPSERAKAAKARGRIAEAVRAGDLAAARTLMGSVHLCNPTANLDMCGEAVDAGNAAMLALLLNTVPTSGWGVAEWEELFERAVAAGHGNALLPALYAAATASRAGRRAVKCAWTLPPRLWALGEPGVDAALWLLSQPDVSQRMLCQALRTLGSCHVVEGEYMGGSMSPLNPRALDPHLDAVADLVWRLAQAPATPVAPPPTLGGGGGGAAAAAPATLPAPPAGARRLLHDGVEAALMASHPRLVAGLTALVARFSEYYRAVGAVEMDHVMADMVLVDDGMVASDEDEEEGGSDMEEDSDGGDASD